MISTRELAKLAGVSQSTISRSLHDSPEISADMKEKIRSLAKEHGYIIRTRTSKTILTPQRRAIGVILMSQPFFTDIFINHLLSILYTTIEKENYYVIPLFDYRGQNGIQKIRDFIKLGLVEGFVIINREYDAELHAYLTEIGIPHVYLIYYSRNSAEQVAVVDTDNYLGGCMAGEHLLALGHRSFATITSPWDEFFDRTNGYRSVINAAGCQLPEENILRGDCSYSAGYQLARDNLAVLSRVTALYVQSEIAAMGAVNAIQDAGLRVPDDISVISTDGLDFGTMIRPQLTSVAHPSANLARITVEKLLELSNCAESRRAMVKTKTLLQPEIILRDSTARPPAQKPGRRPASD